MLPERSAIWVDHFCWMTPDPKVIVNVGLLFNDKSWGLTMFYVRRLATPWQVRASRQDATARRSHNWLVGAALGSQELTLQVNECRASSVLPSAVLCR